MITKIGDIEPLVVAGRRAPAAAFAKLRRLAASEQWQTREVAATALVEIGKRQPEAVLAEAAVWASDPDPNVRRAAGEGLRGLAKADPTRVRPVLDGLRADPSRYVQKAVANVLRNASVGHPDFVLAVCAEWAGARHPATSRIVTDGLRRLETSRPREVARILAACALSSRGHG